MCGIIGYYREEGLPKESVERGVEALRHLAHRGPDGEGVLLLDTKSGKAQLLRTEETPDDVVCSSSLDQYQDGEADLLLGHRRLSIFDTSVQGHQPMQDEAGNWLLHNGEIFNFPELKKDLIQKGHVFRTSSDTEVILAAYRQWGMDCLKAFNGMWAFLLWDAKFHRLIVSGDRFGIKPLYYAQKNRELFFASEVKPFHLFPSIRGELDKDSIMGYIDQGVTDYHQRSFYKGVHRFPSASWTAIELGELSGKGIKPTIYWSPPDEEERVSHRERYEEFSHLFKDSIKIRMRADVPYGVSLSGGLDSSCIIYGVDQLLKDRCDTGRVSSFGAIFPEMEGDESPYIQKVVEDLGLDGTYAYPYSEYEMEDLKRMAWHQDGPPSLSFYAQWCLMRKVRKNGVKTLLGGQGADELLAGYHHHFYPFLRDLFLKGKFLRYLDEVHRYAHLKGYSAFMVHRVAFHELMAWYRQKKDGRFPSEESLRKDFFHAQLPFFLHSDDRISMAFGVETRLPFLDHRLVEFAMKLPMDLKIRKGWQKWILRRTADRVPQEIRWRKDKKGFTTPRQSWLDTYFEEFAAYLDRLRDLGLDPEEDELRERRGSLKNRDFKLFSLGVWLDTQPGI